MAKVKGGLGDSLLIKDLSKPINVHISEALEPPPLYERRGGKRSVEPEVDEVKDDYSSCSKIYKRACTHLEGSDIQIIFHCRESGDSLMLVGTPSKVSISAVTGREGEYEKKEWKDSFFSGINAEEVLLKLSESVYGIELVTDNDFLKFSSLDDFYEWLEM